MSKIPTGRVYGTFTTDIPGAGLGSAGGDVVFRCSALSVTIDNADTKEVYTPGFVRAKIVDGVLYDADDLDNPGVDLLASDAAGISPAGFTWTARGVITSAGKPVAEQSFTVLVSEGQSHNLGDYLGCQTAGAPVVLPGKDGRDGVDGADGQDGRDGADGQDGRDGQDGSDGATGPAGPEGKQGLRGEPGLPGAAGKDGRDGNDGLDSTVPGPQGEPGRDGLDGKPGLDGAPGAPGPEGRQGPKGEPGANGRDGVDGRPGADGSTGPKGDPGEPGVDGRDGKDGAPGPEGRQGPKGDPGAAGLDGKPGLDGRPGLDGASGKDGVTPVFITGTAEYGDALTVAVEPTGTANEYRLNLTVPPLEDLNATAAVPTSFAPDTPGLRWADPAVFGDPRSRLIGDFVIHEGAITNRGGALWAPSGKGWPLFVLGKNFRPQKDITGLALPYIDSVTGAPLGTGQVKVKIIAETGQVYMTTSMSSGATVSLTNLRWMDRTRLTIGLDANLLAGIGPVATRRFMGFSGNASSTTTLIPVEYRSGVYSPIPTVDSWNSIKADGSIGTMADISTAVYVASGSTLDVTTVAVEAGFTGSFEVIKTLEGTVLLRGAVSAGTGGAVAAWLPEGFRPATLVSGGAQDAANGRWTITPAGAVTFHTVGSFSRIPGVLYRTPA